MELLSPLHDRIIVKRIDTGEEETKGGLVIPEQARELGDCAEVVSVGPGKYSDNGDRETMDITVGDKVIINRYAGTDLKYNGDPMLILREPDILATVHD